LLLLLLIIYGSLFLSGIYYCLRVFWCAAARMSELELEQRTNVKFLVVSWCWCWCKFMGIILWIKQQFTSGWNVFSEGRGSVTDEERWGRPVTSRTEENITKVRQIVRENRRLTVRSIARQVNIDRETVRKILTENLDMRKVCAKKVQKCSPKNKGKEEFLATKQITVLEDPAYSPDLAHNDFFLFRR